MGIHYDVIVLGLGGMGSAALYHLARRGARVMGIEQFAVAHDRGSSHGATRLIRRAYFEHPAYVPLVERAMRLWLELESEMGRVLFDETGLALIGRPDGEMITAVQRAARAHEFSVETLSDDACRSRWPGFAPDEGMIGLFEPAAGTLAVEACVRAHVDAARLRGAHVAIHEPVRAVAPSRDVITVSTDQRSLTCDHLVIAGGAWSHRWLGAAHVRLQLLRKTVLWYEVTESWHQRDSGCPVFCFDTPEGFFYGFPVIDATGLKLGEHSGGEPINDPDRLDRSLSTAEAAKVEVFVNRYLRGVGRPRTHDVCMYTMTPDQHFIIDTLPEAPNIVVAAGFSGHGFKFASVVGSILADLSLEGTTAEPIDFLRLSRPALAAKDRPAASQT